MPFTVSRHTKCWKTEINNSDRFGRQQERPIFWKGVLEDEEYKLLIHQEFEISIDNEIEVYSCDSESGNEKNHCNAKQDC